MSPGRHRFTFRQRWRIFEKQFSMMLEEVLARFEMAPDRHLAALVGSFAHPRTEQLAIDMAAPGGSREGRLLAKAWRFGA